MTQSSIAAWNAELNALGNEPGREVVPILDKLLDGGLGLGQHFVVQLTVGGQVGAGKHAVLAAVHGSDGAACLCDEQGPGSHIPGLDAQLPVCICNACTNR